MLIFCKSPKCVGHETERSGPPVEPIDIPRRYQYPWTKPPETLWVYRDSDGLLVTKGQPPKRVRAALYRFVRMKARLD